MRKFRGTLIWLVVLGLFAACTLSGCGDNGDEGGGGGAGTETSQMETADLNA
jgi:hypothetical protein